VRRVRAAFWAATVYETTAERLKSEPEDYCMTGTPMERREVEAKSLLEARRRPDGTCACGCGQTPKGRRSRFCIGHDGKRRHNALVEKFGG